MGSNDLNFKFTLDKYCTRNEVAEAMRTNLIDPIWNEILRFRQMHQVGLPIHDVTRIPYTLTYIEKVSNINGILNEKISTNIIIIRYRAKWM